MVVAGGFSDLSSFSVSSFVPCGNGGVREGGREGGREQVSWEGRREGEREGWREGGREGMRDGGKGRGSEGGGREVRRRKGCEEREGETYDFLFEYRHI